MSPERGNAHALPCTLCAAPSQPYASDARRAYWHCPACTLVYADPASHLDAEAERALYALHQNDPADAGYRTFLQRLATPLLQRLGPAPLQGLDFGCGPGPTLSRILSEAGHQMALYDPFFAPAAEALEARYDFITCTEAIEHFHYPGREWERLLALLKPGGWLGLMTRLRPAQATDFVDWHYRNDPTHVAFFADSTFAWLAARDGLQLEILGADVIILRRC